MYPSPSSRAEDAGLIRAYILVHAEEILRIVFALDLDQPLVVVAVGGLHALLAFVHHEVGVCPAG